MTNPGFLVAENVIKRYGTPSAPLDALRGVSLTVERGAFVAIRGPSGGGKSTLLHILGAMDQPTAGRVMLNDERLDQLSVDRLAIVRRRRIGFVFQSFNLLPTLVVEENVALPLLLDGVAPHVANRAAHQSLAEVGLEHRHRHLPSELSGGEMQRVAIARALAIQPELIIADEPTGSLDSENGQRVLELLAALNQQHALTIVMATHSADAANYAHRTVLIRDGQIQ